MVKRISRRPRSPSRFKQIESSGPEVLAGFSSVI
jgi:hypothetical protein